MGQATIHADGAQRARFIEYLYGQVEMAVRVLVREGVLTSKLWSECRAEIIEEAEKRPSFRTDMICKSLSDALNAPGLDWTMVAVLADRLWDGLPDVPDGQLSTEPGSAIEAAICTLNVGVELFLSDREGRSDPAEMFELLATLGAANEVLRADRHGYLDSQIELTERRRQSAESARRAAEERARIRRGQARTWYRNMGTWLQPLLDDEVLKLGTGISREDAADLARTKWPDPGEDGLPGFDATFEGKAHRQAARPAFSTVMTALKWLEDEGHLHRPTPPKGRPPQVAK